MKIGVDVDVRRASEKRKEGSGGNQITASGTRRKDWRKASGDLRLKLEAREEEYDEVRDEVLKNLETSNYKVNEIPLKLCNPKRKIIKLLGWSKFVFKTFQISFSPFFSQFHSCVPFFVTWYHLQQAEKRVHGFQHFPWYSMMQNRNQYKYDEANFKQIITNIFYLSMIEFPSIRPWFVTLCKYRNKHKAQFPLKPYCCFISTFAFTASYIEISENCGCNRGKNFTKCVQEAKKRNGSIIETMRTEIKENCCVIWA